MDSRSNSDHPSDDDDANTSPPTQNPVSRKRRGNALQMGPRKRPSLTDPLVHYGRHFGRTVHALCNVQALVTNGLLRLVELAERDEESFSAPERHEHKVFQALLDMVPGLEKRLINGSDEDLMYTCDLVQKGASCARANDTKSLKGAVLDWLTPRGVPLNPPLSRNAKLDRGYHHERTGELMCPAELDWHDPTVKAQLRSGEYPVRGDQWPVFLYRDGRYDPDDAWNGLLRSELLISAYKYVFTSPSSVDKEPKATRSGNARIHGMTQVTLPSIAYIATQVRFALSSSAVFSRTDTVTDSERFYNSIVEFLHDPEEQEEVSDLAIWWNRQIFPSFNVRRGAISTNSALARIKEQRARRQGREAQ